jgi:hypothetical protein
LVIALATVLPACGAQHEDPRAIDDAGKSGPDAAIRFDDESTLTLAPGEAQVLSVHADPPDAYEVSFVLLGDALDATLDRTVTVADAQGRASVELRAPSSATTFRVRASLKDGPSTETAVSVSDVGFGSIRILPKYPGNREITEWVGSVVAHTSCAELGPLPGEADGALISKPTDPNEVPVVVENAPVGPTLAVTLRAGHYIWGCKDETHLVAGKGLDVVVSVIDKPIALSATALDLEFTYEPDVPQDYAAMMGAAAQLLSDTAFPLASPEPAILLDEMEALLPAEDAVSFGAARASLGWDALIAQYWSSKGLALRQQLAAWAASGLPTSAKLTGELESVGDAAGQAALTLSTLGGIDAQAAGVPTTHLVTWTADPNDIVHLGGTVFWLPTRFVGAAAVAGAKQELPSVSSVTEAMAALVDCAGLAAALGGFGTCDVACSTDLCEDSLHARWQLGLDASATYNQVGEISFAASAAAKVDDVAAPVSFKGSWLGEAKSGGLSEKIGGSAMATAKAPKDPPAPE